MPSISEINQTQSLIKNSNTTTGPSVLRWSLSPSNSNTTANAESPVNNKADIQAGTGHHLHHGNEIGLSTSDHHEGNTNSMNLAQKIIKKVREKFKAGDVPFP